MVFIQKLTLDEITLSLSNPSKQALCQQWDGKTFE